ncbi:MAG: hypothetical protein ACH34U_01770 [Cyanobium sp.]
MASVDKNMNVFIVLITAAIVIVIRQPLFFTAPRIWAEEGGVYLYHALVHDPTSSFLTPHLGYYSLFNKIAISIASQIFPLRYAALVTTGFSAALQLCTCLVIYATVGRLGRSKLHRYVLALIPLFVAYPETWLNTINAHFWLATGTYFILNSARISVAQILYLLMAFTTGGASLFFLPYFVLRAIKEKTAELWVVVLIGTAAAHIQFFSLYSYLEAGGGDRLKFEFLGNLAKGMLYTFIIPFQQKGAGLFFAMFIVFAIYKYVRLLLTANDRLGLFYSLVSLLTFLLFSVIGSLHMSGGSRYGLPVHSGMLAIAFCGISLDKQTFSESLYKLSLAVLMLLTIASFFKMDSVYSAAWPNWRQQVQKRRCDQNAQVLIFPQWESARWAMILPRNTGVECRRSPSQN